MVGDRVMSVASILSTTRALEAAVGVTVSPMTISKNQSTVQRMRYNNLGNFDK